MVDGVNQALTSALQRVAANRDVAAVPPSQQAERFSASLQNALPKAAQAGAPAAVDPTKAADMDAAARARRALELEATKPAAPQGGDSILDGLQKLRGVFDRQQDRINQVMSSSAMDMKTALSVQMEVARYNMLVEMTSKLAGKSTSTLDTLMKG